VPLRFPVSWPAKIPGAVAWLTALWSATISLIAVPLAYAPAPPDNPLKGFVPYLGERPGFPHSMEWDYTRLSDVMKGPREFDWGPFEAKLEAAAARGHHFYARFYMEWPGRSTGVPQYLLDEGLTLRRWTNTNTQPWPPAVDHTPDYEDPRLRAALTSFIRAFGARYDGDPRLGFIGLGLLGTWGEWHNHPNHEWFASKTVQREVMDAYESAFSQTRLLARYPAGPEDPRYADNSRRRIGYHDDSFAWATVHTGRPQDNWFFESRLRQARATDKWRTQPIGGEVRPELWDCLFDEPSCAPPGQEFERAVTTVHASWLAHQGLFRGPLDAATRTRTVRAAQRLGYELHVTDAVCTLAPPDGPLLVLLTVTNTGVAPFYYDWPVQLGAANDQGRIVDRWPTDWTLSGIVPGEPATAWGTRIHVDHLAPGPYQLLVRAPNRLPNGPPVRFANATQDQHARGWLTVGAFTVEEPIDPPPRVETFLPPRITLEAQLLRITEDHHPALRLTEPLRGLLDAGAQAATELAEVRGNEVDWLGPSIHNSENVRVTLITGPGQLGVEGRVATSRYTLETLKAQPGVEVIAAPRITTLSGRAAHIEVAEVATVLTGIHPQAVVQPDDLPRAIRDPYTAVSVPLGLQLEAHPELADDHDTIDLRLTVTIAEFVGYDATPPEQQVEVWENGEAVWIDPPAPRLRVREVTALAQVRDGETLVLGSWPSPRRDRAPPPWDLSRQAPPSTPPLLILLTPTVLDDDGFPLRPRERQPRNSRVDQP
jgi:hypothetical protein